MTSSGPPRKGTKSASGSRSGEFRLRKLKRVLSALVVLASFSGRFDPLNIQPHPPQRPQSAFRMPDNPSEE